MGNRRRRLVLAAAPAALVLLTAATPLPAQTTAPNPTPVAADAGAGLLVLRTLPGATIPGTPGTGALTGAVALSRATADSTGPANGKSTATSSPFGLSLGGTPIPNPETLSQSAPPDHPTPTTGGNAFPTQLSPLLRGGLLQGSVQARWNDTLGPCVDPISAASTSLADLTAVNTLPALTLPTANDPVAALTGLLGKVQDGFQSQATLLGGGAGTGSVLTMPGTSKVTSTTRLVDVAGQAGKGVQAQSTVSLADITLLPGTPLQTTIKVLSEPTLIATSTGDAATSTVDYSAPVLQFLRNGQEVGRLTANSTDNPLTATVDESAFSIPLQIPLVPNALTGLPAPVLGALGSILTPAAAAGPASLDLGVLPTTTLGAVLGGALPPGSLPNGLLQIGIGEQTARASVGAGGVDCSPRTAPAVLARAASTPPPPGLHRRLLRSDPADLDRHRVDADRRCPARSHATAPTPAQRCHLLTLPPHRTADPTVATIAPTATRGLTLRANASRQASTPSRHRSNACGATPDSTSSTTSLARSGWVGATADPAACSTASR